MLIQMLKAKLHRAVLTQCELNYTGSISIDRDLLDMAGILPFEKVLVVNQSNGSRLETYAIERSAVRGCSASTEPPPAWASQVTW